MQQKQATLPIGTIVRDRYLIEKLLGKSGSVTVYLVKDQEGQQKPFVLKGWIVSNKPVRDRFISEWRGIKQLNHPALPHVYEVFDDAEEKRTYMLIEYIQGANLETLRQQQPDKHFSSTQVLSIMAPVIQAVTYLHHQHPPVIHRNIKPANVIVPTARYGIVLVNFDIARGYDPERTAADVRHHSSNYGAPEQYTRQADLRTDVYGLGATLYTLLTGIVPANTHERLTQLESQGIDPLVSVEQTTPTILPARAEAIHRAMSLKRDDRFPTVEEFWEEFRRTPNHGRMRQQLFTPSLPPEPPSRPAVIQKRPGERVPPPSQPASMRQEPPGALPPEPPSRPAVVQKRPGERVPPPPQPASMRQEPPGALPPEPPSRPAVIQKRPGERVPPPPQPASMRQEPPGALPPEPPPVVRGQEDGDDTTESSEKQPQVSRLHIPRPRFSGSRKRGALLLIVLLLLIGLGVGTSLWAFAGGRYSSGSATPTSVVLHRVTPALPTPHSTRAPTPTSVPNPYPRLAESYAGIIDDISANITTKMALTRIQQNQGNISGYLTVGGELQGNGSFMGTVDTSQHIQFTVIDSTGRATLSFEGIADTDGTLAGSYCALVQQGRCVGDYGVWSVTPAP